MAFSAEGTTPRPAASHPALRGRFVELRYAACNIVGGARTLLFVGGKPPYVTRAQIPILILAGMITLCVLDFLSADPFPYFNFYGFTTALSAYLVVALACYFAALIQGRSSRSIALIVAVVSMAPAAMLAIYLVDMSYGTRFMFSWLVDLANTTFVLSLAVIYAFFAIVSTMIRPGPPAGRRGGRTLCSIFFLAVSVWGYLAAIPAMPIWVSWAPEPEEARERGINVERTFYRQPELVAQALDEVAPSRRGISDLYFVGFAGYGSEQVFLNEISAAADLLAERFDSAGRTVRLANGRKTIDSLPMASASNLRLVLSGVAQKMDVAEDVLFLFLSSHGSKGWLGVENWPLDLNNLSARELRQMLDQTGIKWRVIVVSACYSGSFIETLKNENTLIITAASAEKTSFGCGHDGPFTYFGEAFFGHALPEQSSFSGAFRVAKARIEKRESDEGLTPSEPQLYEGEKIIEKLKTIEFRLGQMARVRALRSALAPPED